MFSFGYDDRIDSSRMNNLRFNPYVGSFSHSLPVRRPAVQSEDASMLLGNRRNPLIGTFRHSPSVNSSSSVGLKGLLLDVIKRPVISQIEIAQSKSKSLTLAELKLIPTSKYLNTSTSSKKSTVETEDFPLCAICLESFSDGDELRNLPCSHCFHRKCIDVWLLGFMTDASLDTCKCPKCRQRAMPESKASVAICTPSACSSSSASFSSSSSWCDATAETHSHCDTCREDLNDFESVASPEEEEEEVEEVCGASAVEVSLGAGIVDEEEEEVSVVADVEEEAEVTHELIDCTSAIQNNDLLVSSEEEGEEGEEGESEIESAEADRGEQEPEDDDQDQVSVISVDEAALLPNSLQFSLHLELACSFHDMDFGSIGIDEVEAEAEARAELDSHSDDDWDLCSPVNDIYRGYTDVGRRR